VVEAVDRGKDGPDATGAMRCVLGVEGGPPGDEADGIVGRPLAVPAPATSATDAPAAGAASDPAAGPDGHGAVAAARDALQRALTTHAGVLRSAGSLEAANAALAEAATVVAAAGGARPSGGTGSAGAELANLVSVGRVLATAAAVRTESRGAHARTDHPDRWPAPQVRLVAGGPPAAH
jgi:L-aspartate oxidase